MTPNSYHKAATVYQRKTDENLSPLQIVVELYKGMIKHTRIAKKSWESRQLDVMTNHITKVFNILEVLQSHLDVEQGGEDAAFLNRFYSVVFSALSLATSKPEPVEEFDKILAYMQQVYDRWYVIAYGRPVSVEEQADSAQA